MKSFNIYIFLISFAFSMNSAYGQGVAKTILVEQFSNTLCGICASRIPQLRNNMQPFEDHIQTISYFIQSPYPNCSLYQSNKQGNASRAGFYGVLGTPTVHVNGTRVNQGAGMVPPEYFDNLDDETTPVFINAHLQLNGMEGNSTVEVSTEEPLNSSSLVLQVIIAEKVVEAGPANYRTHYNVFRDYLTPVDGQPLTGFTVGEKQTFEYSFNLHASWNADQIVVIAFVQDQESKEVWNATNSENFVSNISTGEVQANIKLSPNPAADVLYLSGAGDICKDATIDIWQVNGSLVYKESLPYSDGMSLNIRDLNAGAYIVKVSGSSCSWSKVFIKQ